MKITYTFADGTISEVDVSEELGATITALDREEYNNNHRARRHNCSLEAYDPENRILSSGESIEEDYQKNEICQLLYYAINQLTPKQRKIIEEYYFYNRNMSEIGRLMGIDRTTVRESLNSSKKKIKKIIGNHPPF